ncbi:hypothetical protein PSEUBRA_001551 [Kalmanozyma brasiliensis GHG001]|uniref:uncharacterized protein n=1 Tax=Kalmanozyma brasiliensis (strain GHG001) TaxID=1365824 RepID=UPI002867E020|nr:uncharacterized protein PSEUBRA_001551 [Kalmanozyma brasiliensis GHG001]KAF6766961.1 hypothetical protein PSEUBRA_001551 [Kalmanozyma brasiliensis GHG001]
MEAQSIALPDGALPPSASTTFDPHAVTPAFARRTSSIAPPQPADAPLATSISDAPTPRLVVPELGDPSLMGELPTTDPLSILLQKHLPPHTRPHRDLSGAWPSPSSTGPSAPSVELPDPFSAGSDASSAPTEITPELVRQAASTNAWRRIASLARAQLESSYHTSHPPALVDTASNSDTMEAGEALQWWTIRLYALARLKLYSMLRTELAALWQVLESTTVGEGSLAEAEEVPFSLRVMCATEPKFRGEGEVGERVQLVVVCSRVWIQAGDLTTASKLLDRVRALLTPSSNPAIERELSHARTLIAAIAHDLPSATTTTPNSPAEALNQAIVQFYSAHLDTSIAQLEAVLTAEPALVATADAVVFNLATLYELGKGGEAEVVERKRELLANVARWSGEPGVAGSSFKL